MAFIRAAVIAACLSYSLILPCASQNVDLVMPGAKPTKSNAYLCTSLKVTDGDFFINKFEPLVNASNVHHVMIIVCDGPAYSTYAMWVCPAVCRTGVSMSIVYAWANNASATSLPEDVGFRVKKGSTLVLQIHYARALKDADNSGIRVYMKTEIPKYVAGIYLMIAKSFLIPKGVSAYGIDLSCPYTQNNNMTIFAVRAHTHGLGVVVSGYYNNKTTHLIAKINPQWPQTFYPVKNHIEVKNGDNLFARCIYNSTLSTKAIGVGPAGEMCNYYIMYYTSNTVTNTYMECASNKLTSLTGVNFPSEGNTPLPPNPYLEEVAKGIDPNSTMSKRSAMSEDLKLEEILMPGARPKKHDAYLCTALPLYEEEYYIYKFEALANAETAHHMLLYGCDGEPYSDDSIWDCQPMCKGQSTILFAWAKNAPPTVLPKDVGFRIGSKTSIKTLVLQVHYARTFSDSEPEDHSGLKMYTTRKKPQNIAGIFLLMSGDFRIPPQKPFYPVDISCQFTMKKSIFPFAYRTHAHSLGRVITGYQYNGTYNMIGKGNPQWPQAFYPAQNYVEVKPGDYLAARCTYNSTLMTKTVGVGSTGNDEMCNFYIMFYTDSSVDDPSGDCFSDSCPKLTGDNFPKDVSVPLPSNPELEEEAKGSHHHGGMNHQEEENTYADSKTTDIVMPGAKPSTPDAYLCTSFSVTEDEVYIYKFAALANAATAHHMLLYGCDGEPSSADSIWNCPAMCKNGEPTILFAWAKNAPPTVMPKDVGLRVGSTTLIKTIVLQVHYARVFNESEPSDHSGLRIYKTNQKPHYVAGIFLMASNWFSVPPGIQSYPVDVSCTFQKEKSIFPFAYRTHAHGLGRVITGYQYNGSYHEIGKGNPQWPQAFYPVKDLIEVKPGDSLAIRCTYDSTSMTHSVKVGSTGNDEMCNFYIMFYTDSSVKDPSGSCGYDTLPELTGSNLPIDVSDPLPPNPQLEEEASAHHHAGMNHNEQNGNGTKILEILMRGAKPKETDAYLCTAYPVTDLVSYIYKFEAKAEASTAHHMLLYGCNGDPFSQESIWNCPAMCKDSHAVILFAWAKNAPPTVLPPDVGLRIGSETVIKTLVLQVHYARTFTDDEPEDFSGLKLLVTQTKQPFVAGIFFLGSSDFTVPQGNPSYAVDISCRYLKEKSIFPFAYRTHAHSLGRVITGYQYNDTYHQIGKGNPQWPQTFYPVKDKIEVKSGDYLLARCTYNSTSMTHSVNVGSTGNDEMCNFYIMFYTDSSVSNPYGECARDSVPGLTGHHFPVDVSVPLPPNPQLEDEANGIHHNHQEGMASNANTENHKHQFFKDKGRHLEKVIKTKSKRPLHVVSETKSSRPVHLFNKTKSQGLIHLFGETKSNLKGSSKHDNKWSQVMEQDYDVIDSSRYKRHAQEDYEEYAANDLREKGLYGTATSTEEGLSRNKYRGFEAISKELPNSHRKNSPSKVSQPQEINDNSKVTNPQEINDKSKVINQQNLERRRPPPGPAETANTNQESGVHHSNVHLEHKLEFNATWPEESVSFGQIGGLATDKNGNVYVFHRGSRTWTAQSFNINNDFQDQSSPIPEDVITIVSSSGRLINKFGAGQYYMPHGIAVDQLGNIWLTDVALHQVFKLAPGQTMPSLTLGHRFEHSEDLQHFCKPTDVAVLSSGEFFVSDGYCNSRIIKFSKDGTVIKSWGKRNDILGPSPPPPGAFDIPHSITVSEEHQLVCAADRENGRIQCFDLEGKFTYVIQHPQFGPRLFALEYCPEHGGLLYAVNGPAYDGPYDLTVQGFTLDIKTGDLLELWNLPQHMRNPHDIAVDPASHSVYVGELDPKAVWKFSRLVPSQQPVVHAAEVTTQSPESVSQQTMSNYTSLEKVVKEETDSVSPSIIIGILLVVPVVLLLIIVLLVRAHQSGKLKCYGKKGKIFNLQGFIGNSHKGFDPLSTEESDHESNEDDHTEYLAPRKKKNKA